MPGRMEFARRFRDLRSSVGLTGKALAGPRYSVSYISQIEAGRRKPSSEALAFFADRLGVSPQYLATGLPDGIEVTLRYRLEEARQQIREAKPDAAESALRTILAQTQRFELPRLLAQALSALGDALRQQGRVPEAIDAYEEALEGDLPEWEAGMTVGGLGRAYLSAGDLTYAAEIIQSFLQKESARPLDPSVLSDLQAVLVSIYFERGDVLRAERAARRALAAASDAETPIPVRAVAYWHASRVLAEKRLWDEALELANRARILMEAIDDRRRAGRLHNAYAFICLEAEPPRLEEAREHLDVAQAMLAEGAGPTDRAQVQAERSRLALLENRPDEALTYSEQALSEATSDELELARCLFLKGRALAILARREEARHVFREAASSFEKHGARQQEANCWREIGVLDLAEGDVGAAVESLSAGLEALDPRRTRA